MSATPLLWAFATLYLVWGSSYLAIKYAVATMPPLAMAGVRFTIAGAILYAALRLRGAPVPTREQWRASAFIGVALMCSNAAVAWSERRIDSGIASLLVCMTPCWMVILDAMRLRAWPHAGVTAGLALGIVGIGTLVGPSDLMGGAHVDVWGATVVLAGTLMWALGSVYAQRAPRPASAFLSSGMQMLTGGATLVVVATVVGEWRGFTVAAVSSDSWLAFVYLIAIPSLAGFSAYIYILGHASPARASTYAYVNPVIAVALGAAFGGEPLSARVLTAAAIIVVAVALIVNYGSARRVAGRSATHSSAASLEPGRSEGRL